MVKQMKLLIATDNFLPRWDGISRFLSEIIPRLAKKYEITVIAPDFGEIMIEGIRIIKIPLHDFQIGDFTPAKVKTDIIRQYVNEADVVWVQSIGSIGGTAIKEAKKLKKPIAAYVHSIEWDLVSESVRSWTAFKYLIKIIVKNIAKRLYSKCNILMVPSIDAAKTFNGANIRTIKTIVHLGVNSDKFCPAENRDEAKKKLGINPEHKVIGFCGRLGREKDLITLYRAFVQAQKKYKNTFLLIVGGGLESLKNLFDKDNMRVTGAVNNTEAYLQAMDIYVLPSLTETTSLSTMEAMSCGIAVISTKVGYVQHYIEDRHNGLFFPVRNSYVLKLKIEQLLAEDDTRKRLGDNARKTIIKSFSWNKTVEDIDKVLNELKSLR